MRDICNSMICVTASGVVGIVSEIDNANALFFPFDKDGLTTNYIVTPLTVLKQAALNQIPASCRVLADVQFIELGYVDAPVEATKAAAKLADYSRPFADPVAAAAPVTAPATGA